ncbi:MAG TPA: hypothetical protein DDW47_03090 [Lactobacillus acetotolerans]|jgi:hypothetical protein|nr:hypothetical protein [Lactobacillus acetotolerans]
MANITNSNKNAVDKLIRQWYSGVSAKPSYLVLANLISLLEIKNLGSKQGFQAVDEDYAKAKLANVDWLGNANWREQVKDYDLTLIDSVDADSQERKED